MAIEFRCDYCGRQLSLAEGLAGQETACPNCGVSLLVPAAAAGAYGPDLGGAPTVQTSSRPPEQRVPCPYCGEQIKKEAHKCPHCGEGLGQRPGRSYVDPGIESAATLSLVLGLVGILLCCMAAPFAIWQASVARQKAVAAGVPTPGTATAGAILGWISVALTGLVILFYCVIFGVAAAGGIR